MLRQPDWVINSWAQTRANFICDMVKDGGPLPSGVPDDARRCSKRSLTNLTLVPPIDREMRFQFYGL